MRNIKEFIQEYKNRTQKECYEVEIIENEVPSIMDNKIGGIPYFPKNEKYPTDKHGKPMALLLQVNLSDINLKDYPSKGILEVFITQELDYPQEYEILYFENTSEEQCENIPKINMHNFITEKPLKIKLCKTVCHMPLQDYRADVLIPVLARNICGTSISCAYDLSDDIIDDLCKSIHNPPITIGGYPDFTQSDPRSFKDNTDKDECLFKIDCVANKNLYIGDCGIIWCLLAKQDLLNRKFENAEVDWDCC